MKAFKSLKFLLSLLIMISFLQLNIQAQLGVSMSQEEIPFDKYKINPEITVNITGKYSDNNEKYGCIYKMSGFKCIIEFWDLKENKKLSESEKIQGMPQNGYFSEKNENYLVFVSDPDLKGWIVQTINIKSGKTLNKIKQNVLTNDFSLMHKIINDTLLVTCPKLTKNDTALKVFNILKGEVIKTYSIANMNDGLIEGNCVFKVLKNKKQYSITLLNVLYGTEIQICDLPKKPQKIFYLNDYLFISSGYDGGLTVYDLKPLMDGITVFKPIELKENEPQDGFVTTGPGTPYCVSPDRKYLVSNNGMGIQIWDILSKEKILFMTEDLRVTNAAQQPYENVCFTQDGEMLMGAIFYIGIEGNSHISYWNFKKIINK